MALLTLASFAEEVISHDKLDVTPRRYAKIFDDDAAAWRSPEFDERAPSGALLISRFHAADFCERRYLRFFAGAPPAHWRVGTFHMPTCARAYQVAAFSRSAHASSPFRGYPSIMAWFRAAR